MTESKHNNPPRHLSIEVYRLLDNRAEGLSDDSPRGLELHKLRQAALHEVLDGDPAIHVTRWGDTDDTQSHELVTVSLTILGTTVMNYAVTAAGKWLADKLTEKAFDLTLGQALKKIVALFMEKQDLKELNDFTIKLPDGSWIAVRPPTIGGTLSLQFRDGEIETLKYGPLTELKGS